MLRLSVLVALLWVALFVLPVGNPGELLTMAAVAVLALVALGVREPSAPRVRIRALVLRTRAERLAFLRTRDPDAAGRVRPRAPGQAAAV
ncbi:MAG TPA: DUF6412 domain-containing protein [Actinophytocola sp.]|uniref:DUF6412 domain-containing protein n=1 Tax=Actinophytocola sp. TaxID=1872138 RepID=UPI002DBE8395|nr:DUF6412 domain-containing protein [Actinophytocola sp.]HEU5471666.1 DUF6412 domain-containing protein [Actinophytocola sp.]